MRRHRWEDLPGTPVRWLGLPAWAAFAAASELRRRAYDAGWLRVHGVPVPVVSIGNLTAGGTGKTPATRLVAERLVALGRRPMVLSRGYGAGPDGRNEEASLLGDIPVICHGDRVRSAAAAMAAGADVLVLDDGFQHRRLRRDLDILVVDATRPWGEPDGGPGWMLPVGRRRESLAATTRAGLGWISRAALAGPARVAALRARLPVPAVVPRTAPPTCTPLAGGPALPLGPGPWHLVSGIGHPDAFAADMAAVATVSGHTAFPDHHHYTHADTRLPGARFLTTTKDAVKLRAVVPPDEHGRWWVVHADPILDPEDAALLDAHLRAALAGAGARTGRV
jgi:tetraacyldisaccharide 4'-kinase